MHHGHWLARKCQMMVRVGRSDTAHGPLQLTGEGLLPFNTDKQTAFGLAVFYAFPDATSLYAVNVSSFTVGSPKSNSR